MSARPGAGAARVGRTSLLILVCTIVIGWTLGTADVPLGNVLTVMLETIGITAPDPAIPSWQREILQKSRFPRVVLLVMVGGALSICGAVLQATFRNPMADPGILGVSGGGALGAVLAVATGFSDTFFLAMPLAAFAGALASAMLVYFLAYAAGRPSTSSLLLTGVAISSLTGAGVSLVLLSIEEHHLREMLFWLVGGANERTWVHVELAALPIAVGTLLLLFSHREVDALAMGEEHAASVGVPVARVRLRVLALCALASGAAVCVVGPIAFVGLMVPNALRLAVGSRAAILLPSCVFGGGAFLVACDLLTRLAPVDFLAPVGLVTAISGVPFFLLLLVRSRRNSG